MKKEILEKVLNANKNLIVDGEISSGKTTNVLLPIVGEKIKNKEGFNKEDIIDLKTIAFMDLEDKSLDDVILEVLTLMNEIQDDYDYDLVFIAEDDSVAYLKLATEKLKALLIFLGKKKSM